MKDNSNKIFSKRTIPIVAVSFSLWYFWPYIARFLESHFSGNKSPSNSGLTELGLFGDMFGGLTAFLTLAMLWATLYTNILQLKQFKNLIQIGNLSEARNFNGKIDNDPLFSLVVSYLEEDLLIYRSQYNGSKAAEFSIRGGVISENIDIAVKQMASFFEEFLAFRKASVVDESLTLITFERAKIFVVNKHITAYLKDCADKYKSKDYIIYPNLTELRDNMYKGE